MSDLHTAEYTDSVMATVHNIEAAMGTVEFDVGVNAMMVMLANAGKQSTLDTEEFIAVAMLQLKHLMDNMVPNDQVTH
jgi:hypothetical protein